MNTMFIMMNEARLRRRRAGAGRRRARLPAGPGQWDRVQGKGTPRRPKARACRSSATRRSAAHADEHEVARRGDARAAYVVAAMFDQAHRARRRRRNATQRMPQRRPADPDPQGLVHRDRRRGGLDRHPDPRRHGLHRGDRRRAAPRDARITTIYEGTTGIQANDLIGRRCCATAGARCRRCCRRSTPCAQLEAGDDASFTRSAHACARVEKLADSVRWILATGMGRTSTRC